MKKSEAVAVSEKQVTLRVVLKPIPMTNIGVSTAQVDFDAVKHLLSAKPMRRPNRSRPIT